MMDESKGHLSDAETLARAVRAWALHLLQLLFQLTPLYFEEPFIIGDGLPPDNFLRGLLFLTADPSAHTRAV
jgi:hypothetical protein